MTKLMIVLIILVSISLYQIANEKNLGLAAATSDWRLINSTNTEPDSGCSLKEGKFLCRDHVTCLDYKILCNGTAECPDRSDEGGQCERSCNSSCTTECLKTPSGPQCVCQLGYQLQESSMQCIDIDECQAGLVCSQKCENTEGSFRCSCYKDYQLQDGTKCKADSTDAPTLLFTTDDSVFKVKMVAEGQPEMLQEGLLNPLHLAWYKDDFFGDMYYIWGTRSELGRYDSSQGQLDPFLKHGLKDISGLSTDWVGRMLYIADSGLHCIVACKIEARSDRHICARVLCHNSFTFTAFTLNPITRLMFWSTNGNHTQLERASMDGENRTTLQRDLTKVTSMVCDWTQNHVYYAVAYPYQIKVMREDGTSQMTLVSSVEQEVLSMTIFEDNLFYTMAGSPQITIVDKFSGQYIHKLQGMGTPTLDVMVTHTALQMTDSEGGLVCKNADCGDRDAICLLSAYRKQQFQCVCPAGKLLRERDCVDSTEPPYLLVLDMQEIYRISLQSMWRKDTIPSKLYTKYSANLMVMEYHYGSGKLYYSDTRNGKIIEIPLVSPSQKNGKVIREGNFTVDGLAVDWVGNKLYWTDTRQKVVDVATLDGRHHLTLVSRRLQQPRGIAVHPGRGLLFFSDCGDDTPRLEKCHMDGQHCQVIQRDTMANSIAIDQQSDQIYWLDERSKSILTWGINDNSVRTIIVDHKAERMWGLALHQDVLYWTTADQKDVHYQPVRPGSFISKMDIEAFMATRFTDVKVVSPELQPNVSNGCSVNNGGCSQVCLPKPNNQRSCWCPSGLEDCHVDCGDSSFACDGGCKEGVTRCDGITSCADGADEKNCGKNDCTAEEFRCADGTCIDNRRVCNNFADCEDEADETMCDNGCPSAEEFHCDTSRCIPADKKCDRYRDCDDRTDEMNCPCQAGEYRCKSGECLSNKTRCDGKVDCGSGEDERGCDPRTCRPDEFTCKDFSCISKSLECNGEKDCDDGSDEDTGICHNDASRAAKAEPPVQCAEDEFRCSKSSYCIKQSQVCDEWPHCLKGEDELNCTGSCGPGKFRCLIMNRCVEESWLCDGYPDCCHGILGSDCVDASDEDEAMCGRHTTSTIFPPIPTPALHCDETKMFRCGSGECLRHEQVCDGQNHCFDMSDEGGECETACLDHHGRLGGCEHKCVRTPDGSRCLCPEGSSLMKNKRTCADVNECSADKVNPCSQICENRLGGYKCSCAQGYYLLRDNKSCRVDGADPYLIFAVGSEIRMLTTDKKHFNSLVSGAGSQIQAVDFMSRSRHIYWMDYGMGKIKQYSEATHVRRTIYRNIGLSEGLAVDWMGNNIFYTSEQFQSITACRLGTKYCVKVITENVEKPTTIVISPAGLMFWCDVGSFPRIERATHNGKDRRVVVKRDLVEPMGLAIDHVQQRLYWADPKTGLIASVDFHGKNRKVVLKSTTYKPSAVDVFEDFVYWVDLNHYTIRRIDKRTGGGNEVMHSFTARPYSIKVVHLLKQPQRRVQPGELVNPCENKCSHICLLDPEGAECWCPKGWHHDPMDQDRCIHNKNKLRAKSPAKMAVAPTNQTSPGSEPEFPSCTSNPCMNNGTCILVSQAITCVCADGYTGNKCQNKTGVYLDYSFLTRSNYAWIGGVAGLLVIVVIIVVGILLYVRRKRRLAETEGRPLHFLKGQNGQTESQRRLVPHADSTYDNPGFMDDYNANRKNYTPSITDDSELDNDADLPEIHEQQMHLDTVHSPAHYPPARYPLSSYRYEDSHA